MFDYPELVFVSRLPLKGEDEIDEFAGSGF